MTVRRAAGEQDVVAAGRILGEGFADDPVMTWVYADGGPGATAAMFEFLAVEVYAGLGATFLDADGGAIVWTPPNPEPWPDDRSGRFLAALATTASPADLARLGALNEVMERHHPTEPHWYLSAVAVEPSRRGEGIGTRLLDATIGLADADGLPAYLESSNPRNVPLYERFGFRTTATIDLPGGGPPLVLMWRDAASAPRDDEQR